MHAERPRRGLLLAAAVTLAATGCSGSGGGREQLPSTQRKPARFDFSRPLAALQMTADEAAARAGSFAWEGQVTWSVAREGGSRQATERHRLRQLAGGDFEVELDVDPGAGPGAVTSERISFTKGITYARGAWAPFRERPTDRGHEARRHRDDSFRIAGDLARLFGASLSTQANGETALLGRRALRYALSLTNAVPLPAPRAAAPPGGGLDDATRRRLEFLEQRVPSAVAGELLLDAESALPLSVSLNGTLSQRSDPTLRVEVTLTAQVKALGDAVGTIAPPAEVLPDVRKPRGVARALEAAGYRQAQAKGAGEQEEGEGAAEGEGGE